MSVNGSLRLFDFEFSLFRHALTDGVSFRHLFPWRVHRLPDELLRRMESTYREELVRGCPAAADDGVCQWHFAAARAHWTVGTVCQHLFGDAALEQDGYWEGDLTPTEQRVKPTVRQRVLLLLESLKETTREFGQLPAVGEAAEQIGEYLRTRWHQAEYHLPLYPAFKS
jgi:hypothetical protein